MTAYDVAATLAVARTHHNNTSMHIRTADRCFLLNCLKDTRGLSSILSTNYIIIYDCMIRIIFRLSLDGVRIFATSTIIARRVPIIIISGYYAYYFTLKNYIISYTMCSLYNYIQLLMYNNVIMNNMQT